MTLFTPISYNISTRVSTPNQPIFPIHFPLFPTLLCLQIRVYRAVRGCTAPRLLLEEKLSASLTDEV
jgi:hypothetical protein